MGNVRAAPAVLKCNPCAGISSWPIETKLKQILNPQIAISADIQKHGPYKNCKVYVRTL